MKSVVLSAIALLASVAATSVSAEDYFGVAIEGTDVDSTAEFGGTSTQTVPGLSVIVGRTYDASSFFWGFEGVGTFYFGDTFEQDGNLCTTSANGPYVCELNSAVRVYGVVGKELGTYDVYGKLGYGAAFADFAVNTAAQDSGVIRGVTAAIGVAREMNAGYKLFGEVTYDNFQDDSDQPAGYESEYEAYGLRVGLTKSF